MITGAYFSLRLIPFSFKISLTVNRLYICFIASSEIFTKFTFFCWFGLFFFVFDSPGLYHFVCFRERFENKISVSFLEFKLSTSHPQASPNFVVVVLQFSFLFVHFYQKYQYWHWDYFHYINIIAVIVVIIFILFFIIVIIIIMIIFFNKFAI